jgi:hypothetical protein
LIESVASLAFAESPPVNWFSVRLPVDLERQPITIAEAKFNKSAVAAWLIAYIRFAPSRSVIYVPHSTRNQLGQARTGELPRQWNA